MKKIRAKYYIAYGSNLNLEQMARRCPTAKMIGSTTLKNYRLMFRGGSHTAVPRMRRRWTSMRAGRISTARRLCVSQSTASGSTP